MRPFTVHKAPLCKKIPYFNELFANTERYQCPVFGNSEVVFLNNSTVAWKLLIAWVYTNEIKTFATGENTGSEGWSKVGQILSLAVLAEGLKAVTLADNAMDKLRQIWSFAEQPTPIELSEIFHLAPRTFRSRFFASRALTGWLLDRRLTYKDEKFMGTFDFNKDNIKTVLASNPNMLDDLLEMIQMDVLWDDPSDFTICSYHQHGLDEECPYNYDDSDGSENGESDAGSDVGSGAGNDAGSDVDGDAEGQREVDVLGHPD